MPRVGKVHTLPSANPLGLNNFLYRWAQDHPPRLTFRAATRPQAEAWRRRFLAALRRALGPGPERGDLSVRRGGAREFPGFTRERVYLRASPWHEVPLYLLIPHGARRAPVILALHGHGPGKGAPLNLRHRLYRGYAARYARRGFVVATPDFYPFGERVQPDHLGPGFEVRCNGRFVTAMLYGFTTLGLNVCDVMRVADYLARRPEADVSRLGCMGLSYGGTVAMYASALDYRIRRAALCVSFGAIPGHGLFLDELCGSQVAPGILRLGDMAEIAGCMAPRPLLLEVAVNDRHFPWPATRSELPRLRRIYRRFGAAANLRVDTFRDGHRFYGKTALKWFDEL
jgi:dienelactone hydrolase